MNLVLQVKEKALQIVRTRGPILPVQITKELGVNVMMAGALLSELVDNKVLKISNTKIGGSPVYYVTGQEPKLQSLRDKLNDKQQIAFDMLNRDKILRESLQEPVIRQSLRDIKDFAIPLQVTSGTINEIFWKWYLTTDAEAEVIIGAQLEEISKQQTKAQEKVKDELAKLEEDLKKLEQAKPIEQKVKEQIIRETPKPVEAKKPRVVKEKKVEPVQQIITQPIQEPVNEIDETDAFMKIALTFFKHNNIEAENIKQVRRDMDFECVVKIPSVVGTMTHFCKAKNKQKISDSDLSLLYVQAQMKKMPVLLLTTGELTKKAQDLLKTEFKNITVKKL